MIAVLAGSTVGGFAPELWGGSAMSVSGLVCSSSVGSPGFGSASRPTPTSDRCRCLGCGLV